MTKQFGYGDANAVMAYAWSHYRERERETQQQTQACCSQVSLMLFMLCIRHVSEGRIASSLQHFMLHTWQARKPDWTVDESAHDHAQTWASFLEALLYDLGRPEQAKSPQRVPGLVFRSLALRMPRSTAQMRSRQTVLLQKWADQMPCSWDSVSAACVVSDVCPRRAFPPQEWFVPDTRGEQGKLHIDRQGGDSKVYVDLWTGRLEPRSSLLLVPFLAPTAGPASQMLYFLHCLAILASILI